MHVHHLDCGSLRSIAALEEGLLERRVVCHCLLVETPTDGLVLVDSGLGLADIERPESSLGADFVEFAGPVLDPEQSAIRQVTHLGHNADDVRHVVLTHLHRDHTGGLPDFPHATVHVHPDEYRAVTDPTAEHHVASLSRFMPAHRAHDVRWSLGRPDPNVRWFGADGVATLVGLPSDILMIPLPGHTPGHTAVAIRVGDHWLLHAGDAYLYHAELDDPPVTHPDVEPIQQGAQVDAEARLTGVRWLRTLRDNHADEVTSFCAHDPWEFARLTRT